MDIHELDMILAALKYKPESRVLKDGSIFTPDNTKMYAELRKQRDPLITEKLNKLFPNNQSRIFIPFLNNIIPNLDKIKGKGQKYSHYEVGIYLKSLILNDKNLANMEPKHYYEGYLYGKDGRKFRIGSILNAKITKETDVSVKERIKEYLKTFNMRNPKLAEGMSFAICISKNPIDVAAVSSGQRWSSCMTLPGYHPDKSTQGGVFYHTVKADIVAGTIVAYLIEDTKTGRKLIDPKPYARLSAKPFVLLDGDYSVYEDDYDDNYTGDREISHIPKTKIRFTDVIFINEKAIYSDATLPSNIYEKFSEYFTDWLDSNQNKDENEAIGIYKRLKYIDIDVKGFNMDDVKDDSYNEEEEAYVKFFRNPDKVQINLYEDDKNLKEYIKLPKKIKELYDEVIERLCFNINFNENSIKYYINNAFKLCNNLNTDTSILILNMILNYLDRIDLLMFIVGHKLQFEISTKNNSIFIIINSYCEDLNVNYSYNDNTDSLITMFKKEVLKSSFSGGTFYKSNFNECLFEDRYNEIIESNLRYCNIEDSEIKIEKCNLNTCAIDIDHGQIYNSNLKNCNFSNGFLFDSIFENSNWYYGTFESGKWINSIWEDGEWKEGFIYSEKYEEEIYSIVNPSLFKELEEKLNYEEFKLKVSTNNEQLKLNF